jgi:hypothetical protein
MFWFMIQSDIAKNRKRVATSITGTVFEAIAAVIMVDFVNNSVA